MAIAISSNQTYYKEGDHITFSVTGLSSVPAWQANLYGATNDVELVPGSIVRTADTYSVTYIAKSDSIKESREWLDFNIDPSSLNGGDALAKSHVFIDDFEQHLYTYPSVTERKTGSEFINGVQWLWTDGHSSIWSRALSLINEGQGISPYAEGSWTTKNWSRWGGGGGWNLKWVSDDGRTTLESVQNEPTYTKSDWVENGTHKITAANGDVYNSSFYYESRHRLVGNNSTYVGGKYRGGHLINFTSASEKVSEEIQWESNVSFDSRSVRFENIKNPKFNLNYESDKYKLEWTHSIEQNWGAQSQVRPAFVKYEASGQWVVKDFKIISGGYYFKDKTTGYEFSNSVGSGGIVVNNVADTATIHWTNVKQLSNGISWETPELKLSMSAAAFWGINWGSDIGSDLGGVEGAINSVIAPFTEYVQDEAKKKNNRAVVTDIQGAYVDAGGGNDTLIGAAGSDTLAGGDGDDVVSAGEGDDLIIGGDGRGNDVYSGGTGEDTVKYTSARSGISVNLSAGRSQSIAPNDAAGIGIDQISDIENVIGGDYADRIIGSAANNKITGGKGNDTIDGGTGSDTAIFSAARSAYTISKGAAPASLIVSSSDEGSDLIANVEFFQFADKAYALSEITLDSIDSGTTNGSDLSNPNNRKPSGALSIKGKFSQGGTVTATNTITDLDGIPQAGTLGAISYTWYADNTVLEGVNSSSLTLTQDHVGKSISVKASYTDLFGTTETVSSASSTPVLNVNDAPGGTVSISGIATQNQLLTASNTLTDLDGLGVVSYQWRAGGKDISGATSPTLTLTQAQVGQSISVTASYTDGFGKKESVTSLVTSKVGNVNDLPTGQPAISGTASEDQMLRANTTSIVDADGLGTFKYQWQSSEDGTSWSAIKGATSANYKLSDADVGRYVRTSISYTDKMGTNESINSDSTGRVSNVNDKPVGLPMVTGKLVEGEILTANASKITDADGVGSFSYVWQVSSDKLTWSDVATGATFQLNGNSAKQFVQLVVNYTDGNGTLESVKSMISASIATKALTLLGTLGDDTLDGMSGNDTLYGNSGSDRLTGGAGNDVFIYRSASDSLPSSLDYILDFTAGDKIDLKGIDANTALAGDQAFVFKSGVSTNAVWWSDSMLNGDTNGDAVADFAIHVSLVGLSEMKSSSVVL